MKKYLKNEHYIKRILNEIQRKEFLITKISRIAEDLREILRSDIAYKIKVFV